MTVWAVAQSTLAQTPYGAKPYKGPRALGLIELPPNRKPRFVPIAILVNGEFYDASAYKASPVPMALWSETVYEGFRNGVSQGLFTVTTALENPKTNEWIAEGQWEPAGSAPKKVAKKPESSVPRGIDEDSGPPVLRHSGAKKPAPPETPTAPSTDAAKTDSQSGDKNKSDSQAQTPPAQKDAAPASSMATTAQAQTPTPAPATQTPEQDPDAPVLKRGKQTTKPQSLKSQPATSAGVANSSKASLNSAKAAPAPAKTPQLQLITAISDSGGPDPHPYKYDLKPEDEAIVRKKLFALAADEVAARNKQLAPETASQQPFRASSKRAQSRTSPQPDFQNVQLRAFDLSFSNEPVFVLSANTLRPANGEGSTDSIYSVTLVAREDINGDMHKAFAEVTDADHLDVLPRYELIDAVDADGDGRAELLFRQIADQGSTFAIYRVIGDRLYPLFQTAR